MPRRWQLLPDHYGPLGADTADLTADNDIQRIPSGQDVPFLVMGQVDPDLPVAEPQREAEAPPCARQPRLEGQLLPEIADAAEPEDQRRPHPGCRGDVNPVRGL